MKFLTLIDPSSGNHSLKLVINHIYQYAGLSFGTVPVGNMFQKKINIFISDLLNVLVLLMTF